MKPRLRTTSQSGLRPPRPGCGTQHPQRFACVLLAAAPTTTPCFRHWRRSSLLPLVGEPLAKRLSFAKCQGLSLWESWREAPERARPLQVKHRHSDSIALTKSLPIAAQRLFRAGLALSVIASQCHLSHRERLWQVGPLPTGRPRRNMAQKGGPCYRGQPLLDDAPCQAAAGLDSRALQSTKQISFARPEET